jgi:hypothetical protein
MKMFALGSHQQHIDPKTAANKNYALTMSFIDQ